MLASDIAGRSPEQPNQVDDKTSLTKTESDAAGPGSTAANRMAKMKFSAIWDIEKTPTNCVPRLVSYHFVMFIPAHHV